MARARISPSASTVPLPPGAPPAWITLNARQRHLGRRAEPGTPLYVWFVAEVRRVVPAAEVDAVLAFAATARTQPATYE